MALSPLAASYDHLLLDLDGCVWVGDAPTPGAVEAVAELRRAAKGLAFLTNDAWRSGEDLVQKLWAMGFQASLDEVVTVGGALQHLLAEEHPTGSAVVIGSSALIRHVTDAGLRVVNDTDVVERADVVVVAAYEGLSYAEIRDATQAVLSGARLIGVHRDRTFPMPDGPWPSSGSVLAAVEYATGTVGETLGKPSPRLFHTALDRLGPGRALMVGDRIESDLHGAQAAELDAAIVLTGVASREDAEGAQPPPVAIAATLAELVLA
ncbi:MAG: glycerol-phosphatase [Solirubrobacteraceae bacterium]|nr:glycerol-phosphatase [Solirubrobacteraceae bacterium]